MTRVCTYVALHCTCLTEITISQAKFIHQILQFELESDVSHVVHRQGTCFIRSQWRSEAKYRLGRK